MMTIVRVAAVLTTMTMTTDVVVDGVGIPTTTDPTPQVVSNCLPIGGAGLRLLHRRVRPESTSGCQRRPSPMSRRPKAAKVIAAPILMVLSGR